MRKQLVGRRKLHHLAEVHNADTVGKILDDGQVVRNKQYGKPQPVAQFVQQVDNLRLYRHVQSGNRLVGDNQFGFHNDRPRYAYALTLSARKLVRVSPRVFGHKPYKLQHLIHLLFDVLFILFAVDYKPLGNNVLNGHARVERRYGVLKNHLYARDKPRRVVSLVYVNKHARARRAQHEKHYQKRDGARLRRLVHNDLCGVFGVVINAQPNKLFGSRHA